MKKQKIYECDIPFFGVDHNVMNLIAVYLIKKDVDSLTITCKTIRTALLPYRYKRYSFNYYYYRILMERNQPFRRLHNMDTLDYEDLPPWWENLVHLEFKSNFNRPVYSVNLPKRLKYLRFGSSFNRSIKKLVFPKTLTHLVFGIHFNQPLVGVRFPDTLTHLAFGFYFDQPLNISGVTLPPNLTHITFDPEYRLTNHSIPDNITIEYKLQYIFF